MKRTFDIVFALLCLFLLSPIIIFVYLLVLIKIGSPVFFLQFRPGINGKPFLMIKFRSMKNSLDSDGNLLADAERLTKFGKWLRSTSLDELPELINVLKGDMSFVGPRPLLMDYLPLYTPRQSLRHRVKPGITGWAQVNGRNALSWEEKFAMDLWYVENISFWLDLKIILRTLWKVLTKDGISATGEATMSPFIRENSSKEDS